MYHLLPYTYNSQRGFYNEIYKMYGHVHTFKIATHKLKHCLCYSFSFDFILINFFIYNIIH